MIQSRVLNNNISLVLDSVENSTCAIGFWFKCGSRFEDVENRGISHFTEHLLFKGTNNRTAREIAVNFDKMGGFINAFTERENVCMYCVIPAIGNNVATALEILCDMTENCNFPKEEIEKERNVVQSEIAALEDDSEESALDEVARFVWKNESGLSQSIGGTVEEVQNLTREKIIDWYEKYFVKGELSVFVSGSFDEKTVIDIINSLSVKKSVVKQNLSSVKWNSGIDIYKADFLQNQVYALLPFDFNLDEKKNYALSVLNAIAGDTMSSRLFDSIRERHGLCYSVFSFFTIYSNAACWCAYLSCDKKKVEESSLLLLSELKAIIENPITLDEVENAKNHLLGEEIMGSMDSEYLMKRNQKNFSMNLEIPDTSRVIELIKAVTLEDVKNLAKEIFDFSRLSLVFYGPKLKKSFLKKIKF